MEIYLINNETSEITQTYQDVEKWDYNFVEYRNNGMRGKIYCDSSIEHFSDKQEVLDGNN